MSPSPSRTPTRKALHERSDSQTNILAAVRLVPYTPPRLQGDRDELYSRSALPTHPAHFFPPSAPAVSLGSAFATDHDVSADVLQAKSEALSGLSVTATQQPQQNDQSRPSTATSSKSKRLPKKRKHVALNPDNKTFRVLDIEPPDRVPDDDGPKSASSVESPSPHDRLSFDSRGIDASTKSTASWIQNSTAATTPNSSRRTSSLPLSANNTTHSPWNYQFVGGLRKVPKTPDLKQKATSSSDASIPPLPGKSNRQSSRPELSAKPSFQSSSNVSTESETSNYKVYRGSPSPSDLVVPPASSNGSDQRLNESSRPESQSNQRSDLAPPSSSDSNYQILGYYSQASSEINLPSGNYQVHGDPSPDSSSVVRCSPAGPAYSRESLLVAPLQPRARRSTEHFGYYKSRSRESLRTGSLTSISTVLTQEIAQGPVGSGPLNSNPANNSLTISPLWVASSSLNSARFHMQAYPHQWSSQLSTVPSESDSGTDRGSRSWSDGNGRRSSGFLSSHSRQMPSIGSLRREEENAGISPLEPPQPTLARLTPRLVEDLDEHGDGITDMQDLRLRPSRPRLTDFYSITSELGRTYTMRSTTSSRTNSLLSSSIPTWARLYYGSGERRYLGTPGGSTEYTDSRPPSSIRSLRSGSPDTSNFPLNINSPRKRPRQITSNNARPLSNPRSSMEIAPLPELGSNNFLRYTNSFRQRFRPSSSVLSPHLKRDRRATRDSKFFLEPPSLVWSTEGNLLSSRRNRLITTFVVGFIFPFAWIIGALLPLPPNPAMMTNDGEQTESEFEKMKTMARELDTSDEAKYESARWWRKLNRGMAVLGVLIIAAAIVLAVVSAGQGWAK